MTLLKNFVLKLAIEKSLRNKLENRFEMMRYSFTLVYNITLNTLFLPFLYR